MVSVVRLTRTAFRLSTRSIARTPEAPKLALVVPPVPVPPSVALPVANPRPLFPPGGGGNGKASTFKEAKAGLAARGTMMAKATPTTAGSPALNPAAIRRDTAPTRVARSATITKKRQHPT